MKLKVSAIIILAFISFTTPLTHASNNQECATLLKMFVSGPPVAKKIFKAPEIKYIMTNTIAGQEIIADILEVVRRDVYSMPNLSYRKFLHELDKVPQKKDIIARMNEIQKIVTGLKNSKFDKEDINASLEVLADYILKPSKTQTDDIYFKKMVFPNQADLNELASWTKRALREDKIKRSKLNKFIHEVNSHTKEALTCLRRMPKSKVKSSTVKLAIFQFFITEFFVLSGYVTASDDFENIDWQNLTTDLGVYAVTSLTEPWLATGATTFVGKYLQILALGTTKTGIDATLFYLNPLTNTHGRDKKDVVVDRATFSTIWSFGSAASKVGLYTTLIALQCYVPNTFAMDIINVGGLISYRFANSFLYFKLRKNYLDSKEEEERQNKSY